MAASGNGGGGGEVGGRLVTLAVDNLLPIRLRQLAPQTAGVVPSVLSWVPAQLEQSGRLPRTGQKSQEGT